MSTATVNLASKIASAVNNVTPVICCTYCDMPMSRKELDLIREILQPGETLKAADIMCDKCANAPSTPTIILPKPTPQVVATKPASLPVTPGGNAKSDAFLLATVTKFKSAKRADGKPSGAFAVKVHGYLHAAGIPETKIREAVAGAVLRNVISKMGIATKNGTMILYFDAKERPNSDNALLTPTEKATAATAFGF